MNRIGSLFLFLWSFSASLFASLPFTIDEAGTAISAEIQLCLNAVGEISCYRIPVFHQILHIQMKQPRIYPKAGIRSMTPGNQIVLEGTPCALLSNGYCPVTLDPQATTVVVSPVNAQTNFTVGGTLWGWSRGGLVLKNLTTQETLVISDNAETFQFLQTTPEGGSYNVVVEQQPADNNCIVFNGAGDNVSQDISNIQVACGVPSSIVGMQSGYIAISFDSGSHWLASTRPSSNTSASVNGVFLTFSSQSNNGALYAASSDGSVYVSTNLGYSWSALSEPIDGSAVNGIFVDGDTSTVFAVTQNGSFASIVTSEPSWSVTHPDLGALYSVYYNLYLDQLMIGGTAGQTYYATASETPHTWTPLPSITSSYPVVNVGLTFSGVYYALTQDENFYSGTTSEWSWQGQTLHSFYLSQNSSNVYTGSQDGGVFLINNTHTLSQLGFVDYQPITALCFMDLI